LAALYDWEHDSFDDDVELYRALASRSGGPVLELACGSGRVLGGLVPCGLEMMGVDRSPVMLERARARLRTSAHTDLIEGDLADPLPGGPFGLVILALDALGFVGDTRDQIGLLERIHGVLAPHGLVVLDLLHAATLADQPQGIAVLQRADHAPEFDSDVTKWVVRRLFPATQEVRLDCFFDLTTPRGSMMRVAESTALRYFGRYEMELLLRAAGLKLDALGGGYAMEPFDDESERMIIVARSGRP
jgi:SAM-dependent methyltransferase